MVRIKKSPRKVEFYPKMAMQPQSESSKEKNNASGGEISQASLSFRSFAQLIKKKAVTSTPNKLSNDQKKTSLPSNNTSVETSPPLLKAKKRKSSIQKSAISPVSFHRLVKQIVREQFGRDLKWKKPALHALQEVAEEVISQYFYRANNSASLNGRNTVLARDWKIVTFMQF